MKARIDRLRKFLKKNNIDAAFIAILDVENTLIIPGVRYLTGFSGSTAGIFVTSRTAIFISDFRYADQARKEVKGARVIISDRDPVSSLENLKEAKAKNVKIAIEANRLTIDQKKMLTEKLPDAILVDCPGMIENLGLHKDQAEISNIKKAVAISDEAFARILGFLRPGLAEKEVAAELEYQMKILGAEREAFRTIVASGYRSAMPHGVASEKKLKKGDLVTFDFGALYNGYCSDITRTIVLGKATSRQKKIYGIVLRAQKAAIKKVRSGIDGKVVDKAARDIIKRAGYGKNFGHGTGHGIGFEVHGGPRLSSKISQVLEINMVVTVEPGIYISGWGGVRIEDDVLVKSKGCEVLNKAPKNLLEI